MKLEHIDLAGKSYPLAFSIAALESLEEQFGSLEDFANLLANDGAKLSDRMSAIADALYILMVNGHIAAAEMGKNPPDLPGARVASLLGVDDATRATQKIFAALNLSTERNTEAEPPKNAGPTPDTPPDTLTETAI